MTPKGFEPLFTASGAIKNEGSEQTKTEVISQFGIWQRHGRCSAVATEFVAGTTVQQGFASYRCHSSLPEGVDRLPSLVVPVLIVVDVEADNLE